MEQDQFNGDGSVLGTEEEIDVGKQENIKVIVRVRPLMEHEVIRSGGSVDQVLSLEPPDGKSLTVNGVEARHQLRVRFDACFGGLSTQEEVYSQIRECAGAVVDGMNATVFAYGQVENFRSELVFANNISLPLFFFSRLELERATRCLAPQDTSRH
jgi:hypothetical protein